MLEALFIFAGVGAVAKVCGALIGTDVAVQKAEVAIDEYGRQVEARTTERCETRLASEHRGKMRAATRKWQGAVKQLNTRHDSAFAKERAEHQQAVAELAEEAKTAAAQGAQYGYRTAIDQMVAAGWTPPGDDTEYNPE